MSQKEVFLTRIQKIIISHLQYRFTEQNEFQLAYKAQRAVLWLICVLLPVYLLLLIGHIVSLYSGFTLGIAVCYVVLISMLILLNYER
ncbi:MAG: hypothetical protein EOP47_25250 [Sphingobacteriaceae bacterium]|nr:MAG: hypothetical protein EOP47_25250 [Sphingobacteriaceae bacterium]